MGGARGMAGEKFVTIYPKEETFRNGKLFPLQKGQGHREWDSRGNRGHEGEASNRSTLFFGLKTMSSLEETVPSTTMAESSLLNAEEWIRDGPILRIPAQAGTLEGFREWIMSVEFPPHVLISFIDQEIWIDMSPEEIETHNKIKTAVVSPLHSLNEELDLGELFSDRVQLTNTAAGVSTEADAAFVTWRSYRTGKARLVPVKGRQGRYKELEGTPDWVMEVVSQWSVQKDTRKLRAAYHRARIPEYWLIDARGDEIDFQILVWRKSGYVAVAPRDGWYPSRVFGRSFRLERRRNRMGRWQYKLHVAPARE